MPVDHPDHKIAVHVVSEYLPEQSQPENLRYVHAYHVTITNEGNTSARLINRHWFIVDGNEEVQEVQGEGVIGQQPVLQPGESYRYSSGTILKTPVGCMHGSYEMLADNGEIFQAMIPAFTLAIPGYLN
jgi:ApaG protein